MSKQTKKFILSIVLTIIIYIITALLVDELQLITWFGGAISGTINYILIFKED